MSIIDEQETFTCLACETTLDPDNSDYRHTDKGDGVICYDCVDTEFSHMSTVTIFDTTLTTIHVTDHFIQEDDGDPVDWLDIRREYISTDDWRGYYETSIDRWAVVLDGWTTGAWDDPTARRKAVFNQWAEDIRYEELFPPCPVAFVADPTSNLFSVGIRVLVPIDDYGKFIEWLGEETLSDLKKSLS